MEPTNNAAERALRRAVVWRRRSFGTQSAEGNRFTERLRTVVTTVRQQERDVLNCLTVACTARSGGSRPPRCCPRTCVHQSRGHAAPGRLTIPF